MVEKGVVMLATDLSTGMLKSSLRAWNLDLCSHTIHNNKHITRILSVKLNVKL
jgi:hypothetical protein